MSSSSGAEYDPAMTDIDLDHLETLLYDVRDGVAWVTLNRPEVMNAFNYRMQLELKAVWRNARHDDSVRCIVLTGAGERAFCTGIDREETMGHWVDDPDSAGKAATAVGGGGDTPWHFDDPGENIGPKSNDLWKPVIAAVNGIAAGGGASLALACDIVIARKSASFLQAFAKIGLVPDCGGTYFLPRLIGEARAKAHALLAEPVKAEQAVAWGMIWKAVEDDTLEAEATALANKLAAGPTYALGLTKQALQASLDNDLASQLRLERDLQRKAGASPDYSEGVGAFVAKRPAHFSGRKG